MMVALRLRRNVNETSVSPASMLWTKVEPDLLDTIECHDPTYLPLFRHWRLAFWRSTWRWR